MKAKTKTPEAKKAPSKKKELTPEPKKARALKASIMRGAKYEVPTPSRPANLAELAELLIPHADPNRIGDKSTLQALAEGKGSGLAGGAVIRAAVRAADPAEVEKELAKWSNGEICGYTRENPSRLAAQLVLYGIDSGARGFMLRTEKDWTREGYELKNKDRKIFVITPLFSDKEKEKAADEGADLAEVTVKARKKHYAIYALYPAEDCEQVRVIKRRGPRKQKETVSDYRAAAHAEPAAPDAPAAKKPRKTSPAPAPAAFTPADSADLLQMALAL
jgi:hypothetical protein